MKLVLKIALGIILAPILFVIAIAVFVGIGERVSDTQPTASATESAAPELLITARELKAAFDANEIRAEQFYEGSWPP